MRRKLPNDGCLLVYLALIAATQGVAADNSIGESKISAANTPAGTLSIYMNVLEQHNKNPELAIYTPATRAMLKDWVMTAPQMDNLVYTYSLCNAEPARISKTRRYAVIRYPTDERQCAPWFFEAVDGAWALDLTMMQRAIRFGRGNAWHFESAAEHPYDFAFEDWAFDTYGFPRDR